MLSSPSTMSTTLFPFYASTDLSPVPRQQNPQKLSKTLVKYWKIEVYLAFYRLCTSLNTTLGHSQEFVFNSSLSSLLSPRPRSMCGSQAW